MRSNTPGVNFAGKKANPGPLANQIVLACELRNKKKKICPVPLELVAGAAGCEGFSIIISLIILHTAELHF